MEIENISEKSGFLIMNKAYKIRIYPNKKQEVLIKKTFGCSRFIYNIMLEEHNRVYNKLKSNKELLYSYKYKTEKEYKLEHPFLKEVSAVALVQSHRDLIQSFKNFFVKRAKHPKFHSKYGKQSFRELAHLHFEDKKLKIPKIGWLKTRGYKKDIEPKNIKNVTISRDKTNCYYASIIIDFTPKKLPVNDKAIGLDLGLKHFCITSDKEFVDNPKFYRKSEWKVKKHSKRLSKKKKGSNRRNKQRIVLAKIHKKIYNQRNDFLHKLSFKYISENQVICLEDLNIKGMVKNHCLSKSIHDVSWSEFVSMLEYKSSWYGRTLVKVDRFFPSSKLCSECGCKKNTLGLNERVYSCEHCGMNLDRDLNASLNILREGLNILRNKITPTCNDLTCLAPVGRRSLMLVEHRVNISKVKLRYKLRVMKREASHI